MATLVLAPGHVQPIWAGHPWVYAQAVGRLEGEAIAGAEVLVVDPRGQALGRALYSPGSAIPARLYTRDPAQPLDDALLERRLDHALRRRAGWGLPTAETNAYRLLHAEGDGLPGLIVDVFGEVLVLQYGSVGMKQRAPRVLDLLVRRCSPRAIVDRTTERAAKSEGFTRDSGVVWGDPSVTELRFRERGFSYVVPLELGQKTGYYVDQRPLRERVERLATGRRVLDTYCYVGSMSLAAARGGASDVLGVDTSAAALAVAAQAAQAHQLQARVQWRRQDSWHALAEAEREGGRELVLCDPPKLAPTRASRGGAMKSMQRLCAAATRAVSPGGLLVLSSCSASLDLAALTRALALGASASGRRATVVERVFQGPDHPVPAAFPEGLYLSSVIAEITLEPS